MTQVIINSNIPCDGKGECSQTPSHPIETCWGNKASVKSTPSMALPLTTATEWITNKNTSFHWWKNWDNDNKQVTSAAVDGTVQIHIIMQVICLALMVFVTR